jgi:hypothetical protein
MAPHQPRLLFLIIHGKQGTGPQVLLSFRADSRLNRTNLIHPAEPQSSLLRELSCRSYHSWSLEQTLIVTLQGQAQGDVLGAQGVLRSAGECAFIPEIHSGGPSTSRFEGCVGFRVKLSQAHLNRAGGSLSATHPRCRDSPSRKVNDRSFLRAVDAGEEEIESQRKSAQSSRGKGRIQKETE